jgi:hypothetical protein
MVDRKQELVEKEDAGWKELTDLIARVPEDQLDEPGVTTDGWTVKDMMWHIACWSAESGLQLERIRMGTYEEHDSDADSMNAEFEAEGRRLDLAAVRTELVSARNRALSEWAQVTDMVPEAEEWFYESGAEHYADHLPDLRRWVDKLP